MKPGNVSSAERRPPPTVVAPSRTVTERPARARQIAAASPFGPAPTTTASTTAPAARLVPPARTSATFTLGSRGRVAGPRREGCRGRRQPHRPDQLADRSPDPPRAGLPSLPPGREAIAEQARPDVCRRALRERVPAKQPERRSVALEEPGEERHEPAFGVER